MEKGWINSAREVVYTRKLKKWFIEASKIGDISLTTHNMTFPRCEAYVCRDCHWVIVPYEDDKYNKKATNLTRNVRLSLFHCIFFETSVC